ncbi:hypothetical protein INT48_007861 [Thamnidium elegans]|uniref:BTB domain-containing protein n=1 Tax=Thamnidium elegans TaxID=101142 RepID=A0A8H7W0I4_9FUNG|nr:hypothetical protein INT48_007861 [Thamnidium elegans]
MAVPTSNTPPATSIADLITEFHKTKGSVPPLLIGATTTLIDDSVYLFGGRLQSTRQISNRVYILDLKTKTWTTVIPENKAPSPRYFHSANSDEKNYILFYGGMGVRCTEDGGEELAPLNDLFFLNVSTMSWEYPIEADDAPTHRYAHLSSFVKDRLIVMGGQDVNNEYLTDIQIYDFKKRNWCTPLSTQQFQYGAYRSAAIAVTPVQLTPPFAPSMDLLSEPFQDTSSFQETEITLHTYSNFSTNDVFRQLHSWKLNMKNEMIEMKDQSENIVLGSTLPPPLRFPTAFICGQQFILAGPHLSSANQQYQIWAFDMSSCIWTKIEAGHVLSQGSWLKGLLCENSNRFLVFGHPDRSMANDYKDRVQSFEHLACVNIEIFGIYRPPRPSYSAFGQGLGLSLLKDPALSDLKLITTDGQHILVNSAVLAQRWTSIRQLLKPILSPQPTIISTDSELLETDKRELSFPDTYVVLVAFLQFIYTDHLVTAQQHQPHILARLLFIADLFDIPRLKELAIHALHQMLNIQTASMIYESAILSNAISLQIRALRVLLNAKKIIQRQKQMENERPANLSPTTRTDPHSTSRFLQKYEQNQPGFSPSVRTVPRSNTLSFNSSTHHNRTPSQKSIIPESPPSTPGKTMKLPNFRIRQTSNSDNESPISSATSSPKLTPSSSTTKQHTLPVKSHSSFWRNNNNNNNNQPKNSQLENKPSKSEGTARLGTFNFLHNYN